MADNKKKSNKKKTSGKKAPVTEKGTFFSSPLFIHGMIWAILSLLTGLFMYINTDALIASAMRETLGGTVGLMAYMVPFVFIGTLIYLIYKRSVGRMWLKFILSAAEVVIMASLIGMFADYDTGSAFDMCSEYMNGGGVVGVAIGGGLVKLIGSVAAFMLLAVMFVADACFIANVNIVPYLIRWFKGLEEVSSKAGERVRSGADSYRRKRHEEIDDFEYDSMDRDIYDEGEAETDIKHGPMYVPPEDEELPESLSVRLNDRPQPEETRSARSGNERIDIANYFYENTDRGNTRSENTDPAEDTGAGEEKLDLYDMRFDTAEPDAEPDKGGEDEQELPREEEPVKKQEKKRHDEPEKPELHKEIERAMMEESAEYRTPTLELLDEPARVSGDMRRELYKKAEQLISVLGNFGVNAKPVQVTQGPAVTRYEIQPSSGTKLSKIVNLADDIALNMAVPNVLIAPVPGKAATVGVEIPNRNVTSVRIRELLESDEFRYAKSKLTAAIGKDIGGNVIVGDIAKWPHALVAGATGSGKSVFINSIIVSLLYKADPSEVKLILVDPKKVELGTYDGIPHLLIPVVTEAKKAAGALNWAVAEMMKRYDLFKETGVRKLESYNKLMEKEGGEKLPQIVIIIDELADLMMAAAKEVEDYICRLAQLARAAGIHLVIATQRPSVDVITGLIKANIPSRIALSVSQTVDSRTIIDRSGAEKLLGNGDMLYYPTGARAATRVQGAYVTDTEIERIVEYIKSTSPETHYSEDLEEHIERIASGENGVTPDTDDDGDPLLQEAIALAMELGKISTSMIQRRLSIGYSRAGRLMDQMEARGIVSPQNGSKPREVLVSHADMDMYDGDEE